MLQQLLALFPPEKAHDLAFHAMHAAYSFGCLPDYRYQYPVKIANLTFPNPVGIAAGFDKNALAIPELHRLGFGFVEVGTVTPKAQDGNPKPRLFRLAQQHSIINRMGFNNHGVEHAVQQLQKLRSHPQHKDICVGVNIGKNRDTPVANAYQDYVLCLEAVYPLTDYLTLNISSPNTPGLRSLQKADNLQLLLQRFFEAVSSLEDANGYTRPIFLKIAPDFSPSELQEMLAIVLQYPIAALIVSNTTVDRPTIALNASEQKIYQEAGGLSGRLLKEKAYDLLHQVKGMLPPQFPVISVGGIDSAAEVQKRLDAGAVAVQLYSAFIFQGPSLLKECRRHFSQQKGSH